MGRLGVWWNKLPHQVQALIVFFAGSVFATISKFVTTPDACMSITCWRQYIARGVTAGIVAVFGLYTKSSFYTNTNSLQEKQ